MKEIPHAKRNIRQCAESIENQARMIAEEQDMRKVQARLSLTKECVMMIENNLVIMGL